MFGPDSSWARKFTLIPLSPKTRLHFYARNKMSKYIIANWKMNPKSQYEAVKLAKDTEQLIGHGSSVVTVICPPFTYLNSVGAVLRYSFLGAQDVSAYKSGAYTGQISV